MSNGVGAPARLIEWLGEGEADPSRVGGKAASLIRLARSGFRIPPGSCLTIDAFGAQVALLPGSERLSDDPAALLDAPTRTALVDAMLHGPLSPVIAAALVSPLGRLSREAPGPNGEPAQLALRSSGVAEDGAMAVVVQARPITNLEARA
jgi:phosphoenolpyruvate synthase/pyruvate phosphate dikinase